MGSSAGFFGKHTRLSTVRDFRASPEARCRRSPALVFWRRAGILVLKSKQAQDERHNMNANPDSDWMSPLRAAAEAATRTGHDVRAKIAAATTAATARLGQQQEALRTLTRVVLEGAARGMNGALPAEAHSTLRQVVDGLADGLATSALAAKLALDETRSRGAEFAREDLGQLREHLGQLGDEFTEAVKETARTAYAATAEQSRELNEHARRALDRAKPAFEDALRAAAAHPLELGKEAWHAGVAAARHGTGTLFAELARHLDEAARRLTADRRG